MDYIYSYTRAQAIDDGVLVDVTKTAKEAGIKYPVALTSAVWADINAIPKTSVQDVNGRLWDVLFMFFVNARNTSGRVMYYQIHMPVGQFKKYELKAVIGPGDDEYPVITIMKPNED